MMTKGSRILILVAALALGLVYLLPIWTIDLEAPQYPEGIGMVIRVNTVEGREPNHLANINNLNHYIGMKEIVPESIPELKIMPFVVGALIATGLLVALIGRRRWLYAWVAGFLVISVVGLADFYKWEYDYGHDLDEERAIIKIPGMSYQPPLIGSKQILNFRAHSWPGAGGWITIFACLTGVGVATREWLRARHDAASVPVSDGGDDRPERGRGSSDQRPGRGSPSGPDVRPANAADETGPPSEKSSHGAPTTAALLLLGVTLSACAAPAPRPVAVGDDLCAHCLMVVDDERHAAEAVTNSGVVHVFDSIECLVRETEGELAGADLHSLWVTDYANPPKLIPADEAHYLASPMLTSPMGLGVTAFARVEDRNGAANVFGGKGLTWEETRIYVAESWSDERPPAHGGHASSMLPASERHAGRAEK